MLSASQPLSAADCEAARQVQQRVIAAVDETSLGQADVDEFAGASLSIGIR